jgi:hypothetical protein
MTSLIDKLEEALHMKDDKPMFDKEPSEAAKLAKELAEFSKNLTTQLPAEWIEKSQKLAELLSK